MRGYRQRDLAAISGVSREQIIRLEGGTCEPRLATARALARALECEPEDIFPGDEGSEEALRVGGLKGGSMNASQPTHIKAARLLHKDRVKEIPITLPGRAFFVEGVSDCYIVRVYEPHGRTCSCPAVGDCSHILATNAVLLEESR